MSHHQILVLLSSGDIGGGESVALDQVARFRNVPGFHITLGAPDNGWVAREARRRDVDFWPVQIGGFSPLAGMRIRRKLAGGRYQLVHTHLNVASKVGTRAARKLGIPSVATIHGMNRATDYSLADRLIAVSRACAKHMRAQFRFKSCPPMIVMPNEVDPTLHPDPAGALEIRKALGLSPETVCLCVVGKLHPNKGQRLCLELMEHLDEAHHLIVVGDGPDRNHLEKRVQKTGLGARVHFLGWREDMAAVYAAADLVLVPSLKESFSLAAAEALQCGVRVVGARTGGIPETMDGTGYTVEGRDPRGWARIVRQSLEEAPPFPRPPEHVSGQPLHPIIRIYEELLGEK